MSTTTNLSTLKINYLSQSQYDTALANNQINADELYFTPDSSGNITATDVIVPIKNVSATSVATSDVTATSCDDITAWNAGSLNFAIDSNHSNRLVISFTPPSLSYTARSITGVGGTVSLYGVQAETTTASKVVIV